MRSNLFAVPIVGLLTACGGGSDDTMMTAMNTGGGPDDTGGAGYPEISDTSTTATSTLGGTNLRIDGTVTNISGTFTHNTGATQLSDGSVVLSDFNGGTGLTGLSNGSTSVSVFAGSGLTTSLEYATPVTISAPIGSGSAIIGLVTDPSDVPNSAEAVYTGQSSINVASGAGAFEMTGNATTTANFGTDRVSVTMSSFTSNATPAPFDTLEINNMSISGSGFSGGTARASTGGGTVTPLNGATSLSSRGSFFGYDSVNEIPAELGGAFRIDGDPGEFISGLYTGD